ncbi:serine hydrolase [Pedobacter sp. P351]|uniref:serine hydrolase domain-containing protein n=1 Tax=Pedobacter superstes TaxID=3133441 RepID=UPI00309ED8A2
MKIKKIESWVSIALPVVFLIVMISMSADIDEPVNMKWWEHSRSLESSTILLNNEQNLVPLHDLENMKIASVSLGSSYPRVFSSILKKYSSVTSFTINSSQPAIDTLSANLKFFNTVILEVTDVSLNEAPVKQFINQIQKVKQLVIVAYGNPQSLRFLEKVDCPVLWMPESSREAAIYGAQAIFGGIAITARLPRNISSDIKETGSSTTATRLKYTVPEEAGISSKDLEQPIDNIVAEAIDQRATPGAVVMVVKDGKVIFNKAYGNHTYQKGIPVRTDDIFDLASVTKIGATTIAAMRLYEEGKLKLDTSIGSYIPLARNTDKNTITVKELLLHQAGLIPYIPFFEHLKPVDYSRDSSSFYPVKVADHYFLRANYFREVMWPQMLNSPLESRGKYVYSDVSMYLLKDIIEHQTAESLDSYAASQFYGPLGMHTAGFNPRNRFDIQRIVPTEQDDKFRKTLVHGYVHDQGASMAGGVSGHAGLFSTANDMAILFQMLLNGGTYGGKRYFKPETIDLFTSKNSNVSRRGLGFDRWDPDRTNRYPSDLASDKSYGHTGYTGTCVWVDPEYNLIYIFLSNRVYPTVTNKLSSLRIRPRIQDAIYQAIKKSKN